MKNTILAKSYTLSLTLPRILALSIGGLLIISWFFFLGLVLGRGYLPEQAIPQLAGVMPQPQVQTEATDAPPAGGAPASTTAQTDGEGSITQATGPNNGRSIIVEADKNYRNNIKQDKSKQSGAPSLTVPSQTQQEAAAAQLAGADKTVFAYVYQLASFKEEKAAKDLTAKLTSAGYKARVTMSEGSKSKWYKIILDYTGTQDQAEKATADLQSFKLGKPLMLSKKQAK